ncbi:MAG: tetratricopeptide repeat protein [Chloroflexota bacterium]
MDAIQFVNQEYPEWLPEDRRVMMWIKGKPTELFLLGWEVNGEPEVPMNVPEDVWDKHTRATELLQEGQLETAKTMLREVIAAVPDFPAAYNHLTLAYQMEGRDEEARAMVKDLYARFPDYLFARVAMAQLLTQEKRVEEARTILDPLLRRRRFHFSEFRAVAQAQMAIALAEGSQEGARHWLDMWAEVEPDHPGILQWRLRIEGPDRMLKSLKELTGRFGRQKGDRRGLP